jgi:hypothetical protein
MPDEHAEDIEPGRARGISGARLRKWIGDDDERLASFRSRIWGAVHWRRDIGRSVDEPLSSAFVITHCRWHPALNVGGPEGPVTLPGSWSMIDDVTVWDEQGGTDEFRVGFACGLSGSLMSDDRVLVRLAEGVVWQPLHPEWGRAARIVNPAELTARSTGALATMDFKIEAVPAIRDHR